MHSKQPKRGMVSCEKGYIEVMEYPRAWEAKIVDAETGEIQVIKAGAHEDALAYELSDMEKAIAGDVSCMHLDYTKDVMDQMCIRDRKKAPGVQADRRQKSSGRAG